MCHILAIFPQSDFPFEIFFNGNLDLLKIYLAQKFDEPSCSWSSSTVENRFLPFCLFKVFIFVSFLFSLSPFRTICKAFFYLKMKKKMESPITSFLWYYFLPQRITKHFKNVLFKSKQISLNRFLNLFSTEPRIKRHYSGFTFVLIQSFGSLHPFWNLCYKIVLKMLNFYIVVEIFNEYQYGAN